MGMSVDCVDSHAREYAGSTHAAEPQQPALRLRVARALIHYTIKDLTDVAHIMMMQSVPETVMMMRAMMIPTAMRVMMITKVVKARAEAKTKRKISREINHQVLPEMEITPTLRLNSVQKATHKFMRIRLM